MFFETPYFDALRAAIRSLGGFDNAHLHLDRSGTLELDQNLSRFSQLPLSAKHGLIPRIHASPAYDPDRLASRTNGYLDALARAGTRRAATAVDVTADRVGLTALEVFLRLKRERRPELELEVGAYSPLGFRDDEPGRWALLEQAAERADFLGSLPERDDRRDYPEHIGFREHCRRMLGLAQRSGKPLHVHVDQRNEPTENGAETLLEVLEASGLEAPAGAEPRLWLIHLISPSTYDEARFQALVERMARHRVGVICCPSAAISMRQLRGVATPTGNSIARVLDLLAAGIPVRLGSDNICDITSPAGLPDLMAEIFVLCNAVRFYDIGILAKLGAGRRLDATEIERVREHLEDDRREVQRAIRRISPPVSG